MSAAQNDQELRQSGVVLVGYRGSGKTTVGELLAARLGVCFVDTDAVVRAEAGCGIAEVFAREGESGFRVRERRAIADVVRRRGGVIAVGGGAIESVENRVMLKGYGLVVWLRAPASVLWARMDDDPVSRSQRPDLASGGLAEVEEVLARRTRWYAEAADWCVDVTERSPAAVVEVIRERLLA